MMRSLKTTKPLLYFIILSVSSLFSGCSSDASPVSAEELLTALKSDQAPLVLDVRTPAEYAAGHVPSAINIPHTELDQRLDEIKMHIDTPVVVYCKSGRRAGIAIGILQNNGFSQIMHLDGDMNGWLNNRHPIEK